MHLLVAFLNSSKVSVFSLPSSQIRIALKDWPHVQEFYRKSFTSQHYDVVYILRKLIVEKAVFYTAMSVMVNIYKP